MKVCKIYLSHSIRGKKGNKATNEDMEHNNELAIIIANKLRRKFDGKIELYCPAEHDEFVLIAYRKDYLTESQILSVDCSILSQRDLLLVYAKDNFISRGMKIEIEYANGINLPIHYFNDVSSKSIKEIEQAIKQVLDWKYPKGDN